VTGPQEDRLAERIRQQLDREAGQLDELTVARLRAARLHALERARRPHYRWLALLGTAAVAAIVVAVLYWQPPADLPGAIDDLDIVATGDEMELFEDLDFYDWLDETQTAG
jgi:ferric-dicitrate binding protein FerR (iron transport regulator)